MISRIQVGLDVSKLWFDVHILLPRQSRTERYGNTQEGIRRFILDALDLGARKVHVCLEYTGGLEHPIAMACRQAGLIVSIVDGSRIAKYRLSFSSTGSGTDRKSAYLLARYCKERRPEEWFPVPDEYRKLRELVRHRERLVQSRSEWSCRAANAVEDELVQAQRNSIIEILRLQVEEADRRIAQHVAEHANLARAAELLQTIPGIGIRTACRLLGEMGPVQDYGSAKSLALAAGLVPIVVHSGQRLPPGKLPVYGNRGLRTALFYPALVCKRNGVGVAAFIERVGSKDKLKMTAIVAGMRKLAHVVHGVLSHETPYDPKLMANSP